MSHYAVAVFCDKPNYYRFGCLLEPYSETDEKYFVFEPIDDSEIMKSWEEFRKENPSWKYSDWLEHSYTLRDGRYGRWYNPNARWDYYTLDGRAGMYEYTPEAAKERDILDFDYPGFDKKSEIDWFRRDEVEDDDGMVHDEAYYRYEYDRIINEGGDGFWSDKYYEERYGSAAQYAKERIRPIVPYAFITPDGVWHAPGRVGWFATSDETAESMDAYYDEWVTFITEAPDCYVSLVDCHI